MFGLHLLKQGLVSESQLIQALDEQRARSVPIGKLAIENNYLRALDVVNVLAAQAQRGLRFGELALDMGVLTEEKLIDLLEIQRQRKPELEDIFITKGWVTPADVERQRHVYARTTI